MLIPLCLSLLPCRYLAGGPEDCLKHFVLVALLRRFVKKSHPFTYIDAHAGSGLYDLKSDESQVFCNHEDGIVHIMNGVRKQVVSGAVYQLMHSTLEKRNAALKNPGFQHYLGSAAWALEWLRHQDQAVLFELSAEVIADLRRSLSILTRTSQASVRVVQANSYEQLIRNPPQCHQRQLIFLDPPYDSASTYFTWNIYMLRRLYKHWTSATIVLWFPYYSPEQTDVLLKRVQQLRLGQVLVVQMILRRRSRQLLGSGLLVLRPPSYLQVSAPSLSARELWREHEQGQLLGSFTDAKTGYRLQISFCQHTAHERGVDVHFVVASLFAFARKNCRKVCLNWCECLVDLEVRQQQCVHVLLFRLVERDNHDERRGGWVKGGRGVGEVEKRIAIGNMAHRSLSGWAASDMADWAGSSNGGVALMPMSDAPGGIACCPSPSTPTGTCATIPPGVCIIAAVWIPVQQQPQLPLPARAFQAISPTKSSNIASLSIPHVSSPPVAPPELEAPGFQEVSAPPPPSQEPSLPALEKDALPSVGSVGHEEGTCRPCAFVFKKGCDSGSQCTFCHLCPPGEKKRRLKERGAKKATEGTSTP
ncbi:rlmJ [Symbiodinium natans]|uniref:RlmJ protein n=1 Tax=Symbiodinium natans TaxID=878477 RepID=A0A812UWD3_9DINO|nr:rlmJ [Symbiodinium natans]